MVPNVRPVAIIIVMYDAFFDACLNARATGHTPTILATTFTAKSAAISGQAATAALSDTSVPGLMR